jgi:predicted nucleic acid-binding protein
MTTSGTERVFIDTNVLLYAHLLGSPLYRAAVHRLEELEAGGAELWISRQTVREFLSATTTPGVLSEAIPLDKLVTDVRHMLKRFHVAEDSPQVTDRLLFLLESTPISGKQVHDAAVVATMLAHDIPRLLTHNIGDFARFGAFITVLPLLP